MQKQRKVWIFLLLTAALALLVYLASGINQLHFLPGKVFDIHTNLKAIATLLSLMVLVMIVCYIILRPKRRQPTSISKKTSLLSIILQYGLLFFILFLINRRSFTRNIHPLIPPYIQTITKQTNTLPVHDFSGYTPDGTAYFLSFFFLLIFGLIIWQIYQRNKANISIHDEIAANAQQTLDEVSMKGNLGDTIFQCYLNMCRILKKHFGIERNTAMTTREFENKLIKLGFREEAVINLTRLFEDVRYGANTPTKIDEQRAVASLKAIITSSKSIKST